MRFVAFALALTVAGTASAQTTPPPVAAVPQAQTQVPAPAPAGAYSTATTTIGQILADPAATAVVESVFPGFSAAPQLQSDMAKGLTLKQVQQFAPAMVTDEKLAQVDAGFAKLPPKAN